MTSRVLRALSAFTLFVGAVSLLPGSARADASRSESHPVEVGIGGVSPQVPDFTDTGKPMTFTGSLHNTGSTTLKNVHLELHRSAVNSRSQMGSADGDGVDVELPKSTAKLPEVLAPNASASWQLAPTERQLFGYLKPAAVPPGVYAIDVDAFDSDGVFLGGQRTYVVWRPKQMKNADVARIALMWPVVGQPGLTGQKKADSSALPILADQSAAQQFADNGRLTRIMKDGMNLPVNWLVDPDVLYTASQLTGGYFYPDPQNPKNLTGAPGDEAAAWHTLATGILSSPQARNCWNLMYGDPDLNTLSHAKDVKGVKDSKDLLNAAAGVTAPVATGCQQSGPTIAWPSDGQADTTTLAAIAGTKAPNLVTLVGSNAVSLWPSAHASFPDSPNTVVYDNYLSGLFTPSSTSDADVLAGQMWLAQTALAGKDNTNRVLVVTPPRNFDPGPQLLNAIKSSTVPNSEQWFGLDGLDRVLSAPATPEHASTALTKIATPNLSNGVVETASDSRKLYQALHAIMPGHPYDPAVPFRPVATWWRGQSGVEAYSKAVYDTVVTDHGLVAFGAQSPPLTMSGKSGTVPVSINNKTNATIRVYLGTRTEHTLQLKADPNQGAHTVDPGQSATVRIPVRGEGNGNEIKLYATLYTCADISPDCAYYPSGLSTPLKEDGGQTAVTVKVSRIGIIALGLMIGSGIVLVLLIGLRVYRAKRTHHAPAQDTMAS